MRKLIERADHRSEREGGRRDDTTRPMSLGGAIDEALWPGTLSPGGATVGHIGRTPTATQRDPPGVGGVSDGAWEGRRPRRLRCHRIGRIVSRMNDGRGLLAPLP